MKRLMMILLALALCLPAALAEEAVTEAYVQERLENNAYVNLLDVRTEEEFDAGHIPGAVLLPLDTLEDSMRALLNQGFNAMDIEIIVYAQNAGDAQSAAAILQSLKFTNVKYLASFDEWTGTTVTTAEEKRIFGGLDTVDIYGGAVDDALLRGHQLTMVNVWGTFCGPCIQEMPELAKLHADYAEKGVQVVGLLCDVLDRDGKPSESQLDLARQIAEATGANYPHLVPSAALTEKVLSTVYAVPTTFFVDETGTQIGEVYMGARDYAGWSAIVDDLLGQAP